MQSSVGPLFLYQLTEQMKQIHQRILRRPQGVSLDPRMEPKERSLGEENLLTNKGLWHEWKTHCCVRLVRFWICVFTSLNNSLGSTTSSIVLCCNIKASTALERNIGLWISMLQETQNFCIYRVAYFFLLIFWPHFPIGGSVKMLFCIENHVGISDINFMPSQKWDNQA